MDIFKPSEEFKKKRLKSWEAFYTGLELLENVDNTELTQEELDRICERRTERKNSSRQRESIITPNLSKIPPNSVTANKNRTIYNNFEIEPIIKQNNLVHYVDSDTDSVSTTNYILECKKQFKKSKVKSRSKIKFKNKNRNSILSTQTAKGLDKLHAAPCITENITKPTVTVDVKLSQEIKIIISPIKKHLMKFIYNKLSSDDDDDHDNLSQLKYNSLLDDLQNKNDSLKKVDNVIISNHNISSACSKKCIGNIKSKNIDSVIAKIKSQSPMENKLNKNDSILNSLDNEQNILTIKIKSNEHGLENDQIIDDDFIFDDFIFTPIKTVCKELKSPIIKSGFKANTTVRQNLFHCSENKENESYTDTTNSDGISQISFESPHKTRGRKILSFDSPNTTMKAKNNTTSHQKSIIKETVDSGLENIYSNGNVFKETYTKRNRLKKVIHIESSDDENLSFEDDTLVNKSSGILTFNSNCNKSSTKKVKSNVKICERQKSLIKKNIEACEQKNEILHLDLKVNNEEYHSKDLDKMNKIKIKKDDFVIKINQPNKKLIIIPSEKQTNSNSMCKINNRINESVRTETYENNNNEIFPSDKYTIKIKNDERKQKTLKDTINSMENTIIDESVNSIYINKKELELAKYNKKTTQKLNESQNEQMIIFSTENNERVVYDSTDDEDNIFIKKPTKLKKNENIKYLSTDHTIIEHKNKSIHTNDFVDILIPNLLDRNKQIEQNKILNESVKRETKKKRLMVYCDEINDQNIESNNNDLENSILFKTLTHKFKLKPIESKRKKNDSDQSLICSTPYKNKKRKREILDISAIEEVNA